MREYPNVGPRSALGGGRRSADKPKRHPHSGKGEANWRDVGDGHGESPSPSERDAICTQHQVPIHKRPVG